MKLNHMNLPVPDVAEARQFYERYFGFTFSFDEDHGKLVFLRDEAGFLLALRQAESNSDVLPPSFHFGFRIESLEEVRKLYETMKQDGVSFAKELRSGERWATFYCWAPGKAQLEVSWDSPST